MDGNPPSCSVHGVLQARILEWVAITSSRGSSQPRDGTLVFCASCIGRQILYHLSIWEALPKAVDIYKNVKISQRQPRHTMPWRGAFQLEKITHLRSARECKSSQIKHVEWDIYFNRHAEVFRSLRDSKIASLKDSWKGFISKMLTKIKDSRGT